MEWKLGEIKQINGEMYQCVRGQSGEKCIGCSFKFSSICIYFHCLESERKDHMKVIFKKLEKVGKPYMYKGRFVQPYKRDNDFILLEHGSNNIIDYKHE